MLFSSRLPLSNLIELCRSLRHNLGAGLTLRDVFRQQAHRGPAGFRSVAARIQDDLEGGESLEKALKRERGAFPPLFLSLATVGEQTGHLPEVFGELEKYFSLQKRLWRIFMAQIAWPVFQLIAAIFVIAGMIFILGILSSPGSKPFDPLGFGLTGSAGAVTFLCLAFGSIAAVLGGYFLVTRVLKKQEIVDGILLRIPVVGPTLLALALTRFCLALRLTLETGMSVASALRLCLRATGNAGFTGYADAILDSVKGGEDLATSLSLCPFFPQEFIHILESAEEGGRVTEAMRHQSDYYEEEAARRLTILTWAAGVVVWLAVAILIIIVIFRIALTYIGMLDPANYGL